MERKQFHTLLHNYTALTQEEAKLLVLLEDEFPYSQVIHGLAARATQDNHLSESEEQLHLAAIYTTDRGVFKSIMTAAKQERKSELIDDSQSEDKLEHTVTLHVETEEEIKESLTHTTKTEAGAIIPLGSSFHDSSPLDDSFYDEIQHDLERLKELKHEFEETVRHLENGTLPPTAAIDLKKKKIVDPTDELLTEIKSTKKKIKPEGPKQKEQIEIIDQFIKTQPTIKGKMVDEKVTQKDDLSEKSLTYNENIISETLAEILIKQGKKEKAIDVLKKLIWKFPQKKAYFAAQIEDLKK